MKVETALKRVKQHCVYHKCQGCCFKKICDALNFNVLQLTNDMLRIKAKQKREGHANNISKRVDEDFKIQLKIHEELKNANENILERTQ